jgi:RES domain-containing protein
LSFRTVVYRATAHDAPLWAFPNTSAGRWNRANGWPAQYLSLHPMTPWAEVMRTLGLREEAAGAMRVPIWAFQLTLAEQPLELGFGAAAAHDLDPGDLVADDWSPCQALASRLRDDGVAAIVVPSAALPGTRNLVVLHPAAVIDYHCEPIDPEDQPASMVARDGRCPAGLWRCVHHRRGEAEHAALRAHRAGEDYEFTQPAGS